MDSLLPLRRWARARIAATGTSSLWPLLFLLAGIVVASVSTFTAPETYPIADTATTSIYTLRAGHAELAVGAYSRFYWHHPGPLLYQVFALPYWASGRREISLKWTALAVNLIWLSGLFSLVYRRSPRLAIAMAAAFVPLLWREQQLLFATWNPMAPVLALPLAVAAAADVGSGGRRSIALLVAVLSYCVQAHVGLIVVSASAILGAGVSARLLLPMDASTWWSGRRQPLLFATSLGLLLWAVPLVHEVRTWPGNFAAIARFFQDASPHPSWARSVAVAAYTLNGPFLPSWEAMADIVPHQLAKWVQWWTALQGLLIAAAAVVAARRGDRFESALAIVCGVCTLMVPLAVHGMVGRMHAYLLVWVESLGALTTAVLLAAVARWVAVPQRAWARAGKPLLMACVVFWMLVGANRLMAKHADQANNTTIRALTVDLQSYCHTHNIERPLIAFNGDEWQQGVGIVLQYYKQDLAIAVPDAAVYIVGEPFARTGREDAEFYIMSTAGTELPVARDREWITSRGGHRIVRLMR